MPAEAPVFAFAVEGVNDARGGPTRVSARLDAPADAWAAYVFAHGAGAGMNHSFMAGFANGLNELGIATLRYQFPFMERGSRRTDLHVVAQATVRAAVDEASRRLPGVPLLAGGKSYGGRMTSQAAAAAPLAGVRGLVFVGFPLHVAGRPDVQRAAHLAKVGVPMLFLQGTRDELAELELIRSVVQGLAGRAELRIFEDADHAFHVRAKSGGNDAATRTAMLGAMIAWARMLL